MATTTMGAAVAAPTQRDAAKVENPKDSAIVFDYFFNIEGTTLDCMLATGIMRWSITWHVRHLEDLGLIRVVRRARDKHTGKMAGYYSTNPERWKDIKREPTFFDDFFNEQEGGCDGKI